MPLGNSAEALPPPDAASMCLSEAVELFCRVQLVVVQRLEARELPHGDWAKDEPNKLH